jgi:hypothetical protein
MVDGSVKDASPDPPARRITAPNIRDYAYIFWRACLKGKDALNNISLVLTATGSMARKQEETLPEPTSPTYNPPIEHILTPALSHAPEPYQDRHKEDTP